MYKELHPTLIKLISKLKSYNYLEQMEQTLLKDFNVNVLIGSEIEFYLTGINIEQMKLKLLEYNFYQERGHNQYEYNIGPTDQAFQLAANITSSIQCIKKTAKMLGGEAIFTPKPFLNDYGNAMQFQLSFNSNFNKELIENLASFFCEKALETCAVFIGTEEDYLRLNHKFMAPTNVSWGNNNRSCLIRITGKQNDRIEHRLASPINDPYLCLATILTIIKNFLERKQQVKYYSKIWGNAWENQYEAKKLPASLNDAITLFNYNFFVIR